MIMQQERTICGDADKSEDKIVKLIDNTFLELIHETGNTGKIDNGEANVSFYQFCFYYFA